MAVVFYRFQRARLARQREVRQAYIGGLYPATLYWNKRKPGPSRDIELVTDGPSRKVWGGINPSM